MKAVVYEKAGRANAAVKQVPYPVCGAGDVIIKIHSCGICKGAEAGHDTCGTGLAKYPVIPGHEFSGTIAEIGADVTGFKVGDRVTADNTVPCGSCYYCKRDLPNYCDNYGSLGHNINGGFAEYVKVSYEKTFLIPDDMSFNTATFVEPVACCINALDRLELKYGEDVVIFGAGPNGILLAQLIQHSNAASVTVVGSTQSKLDVLNELGIETLLMNRDDYSLHTAALKKRFPNGVDVVIDATANAKVIAHTFDLLKKGGRMLQYSVPVGETVTIDPLFISIRELTYYSACCQTHKYDRALDALSRGIISTDRLVTHEFALDDYFEVLDCNMRDRSAIKVIVHP